MIKPEVKTRGIELGKKILDDVKTAKLAVTKEAENWANGVGLLIAQREDDLRAAKAEGNKFLIEKNKDALERLSFETAEISELSELIRDKTILEVLKKGGKAAAAFALSTILAAG